MIHPLLFFVWSATICDAVASSTPMAVAFPCGRPSLYLTKEGWIRGSLQLCLPTEPVVVQYCRRIYSNTNIVHATYSPVIEVKVKEPCTADTSHDCLLTGNETYSIQPWICTTPTQRILLSKISAPCRLLQLETATTSICRKESHWLDLAKIRCRKVHKLQYTKPCIKPDDYTQLHFLGADLVCCDSETIDGPGALDHNLKDVEKQNFAGMEGESVYHQYLGILPAAVDKVFERNQFVAAKLALNESVRRKRRLLEQRLMEAESHLMTDEWVTKPELAQASENAAHKEFRQQYVKLMEEARATEHRLDMVHQRRVLQLMKSHEEDAALAWNAAINSRPPNLTQVLKAVEHLMNVIHRNRHHLIKRFEHLRSVDPVASKAALEELKHGLTDLNHTIEYNLAKLEQVPAFKVAVLEFVTNLTDTRYSELNAFARSVFSLEEDLDLSNCHNDYLLEAQRIIEKHRHHLSPLDIEKSVRVTKKPAISGSPRFAMVVDVAGSSQHLGGDATQHQLDTSTELTDVGQPGAAGSSLIFPKRIEYSSTFVTSPQINVTIHDVSYAVSRHTSFNPFLTILFSVLFCLGLAVFAAFFCQFRLRRMRLQRAGYVPTVVEVPEVKNESSLLRARSDIGLITDDAELLSHWQLNGYENPAYKFPDNIIRFSHPS